MWCVRVVCPCGVSVCVCVRACVRACVRVCVLHVWFASIVIIIDVIDFADMYSSVVLCIYYHICVSVVSWASASSCAHNTLIVTGTPSCATGGASAANQHIHDFGGSREGSPGWYPADFRFDPTTEARARQHLLGDDGLAPYIQLGVSYL